MPQIFRIGPYSIYFYFLRFSYFSAASFCPIGFYLNGDAPKMDLKTICIRSVLSIKQ